MNSINKQAVILHTKSEWDTWIELIKTSALKHDIWKLVNPYTNESELPVIEEPTRPSPNDVRTPVTGSTITKLSELTPDEKEEYSFLKEEYIRQTRKYERQAEALADLRIKIQESIHTSNITFTYDCDTVYQMLKNLANQFSPTDEIRKQEIELEWQNLQSSWSKGVEVDQWLHGWEVTYNKMARIKSSDIEGLKPVYKFLNSINTMDTQFATSWMLKLSMGDKTTFPELLVIFRNYRRNSANLLKYQAQHGVFPVLQGINESGEPKNTHGNTSGSTKQKLKCPCGSKHNFGRTMKYCAYLIPEAAKFWNQHLDPEKMKNVEEKLKSDEGFRNQVSKWRTDYKPPKGKNSSNSQDNAHNQRPTTPPIVAIASTGKMSAFNTTESTFQVSGSLTKPVYDLEQSWILDSGATVHVCNNRSRYNKFNATANSEDVLWAGDTQIRIQGYGEVIIYLKSDKYPAGRPLTLKNVAFVPTLHTNVTSLRLLNIAGVHWDTELSILKLNGRHFADTPMIFNQWVLEYKPILPSSEHVYNASLQNFKNDQKQMHGNSSRASKTQTGTYDDWHVRMGHLYKEALLKLPLVTKGCKMTTTKPTKQVCEVCRLSNAKRIISRQPRVRATRPFWRVSWDLIQMRPNLEGEVYVLHFICDYTRMHFVYILPNKMQDSLINTFISFVEYVKRHWGFDIVTWKGDGEKSLGSKWVVWINSHGYEVETSSPETQEQNGDAERSGGMLQILGFLKEYLGISNPEPSIAHLQPYGCKAFAFIKNRPKLDKLVPRAEIGYLVGYESTNIFRIWIPTRNIVIATRDVTFDPTQGYSPNNQLQPIPNEIIDILHIPQLELNTSDDNYIQEAIDTREENLEVSSSTASDNEKQVTSSNEPKKSQWKGYVRVENENDGKPTQEIVGDPNNERNIIIGKRSRKPKAQFHLEIHNNLDQQSAFHAAFQMGNKIIKPKLHKSNLPPEPENWSQLKYHPFKEEFEAAAYLEYTTLEKQGTFRSVPQDVVNVKPIPVKWVFTYKTDNDGYLVKFKARMVIRGDLQIPTEKDTYAATLAMRVNRAVLSICAYFDLETNQFDVTNAFPHADLDDDEIVIINYPEGFEIPGHKLRVLKALYGLSISPRLWYNHLAVTLKNLGLNPVPESGCVFCNEKLIVCFYVDDISVFYHIRNSQFFESFKKSLLNTYTVKNMGELKWFLGLRILRDRSQRKLWLVQDAYIEKIASNFGRIDSNGQIRTKVYDTPMAVDELKIFDGKATSHQIHEFQRRVGSLTYAAMVSRPDIAKATQKLAEAQQNPSQDHLEAANRVLDYLYNTRYLALEYGMNQEGPVFIAASDASYGDNVPGRTSSEGGLFKLFGGAIDYFAKKQKTVTTSSTESELLALSHLCAWLIWWERFFTNLDLDIEQNLTAWCDNMQTVRLMLKETPKLVTKLKHIDIHQHWLRQECQKGNIKLEWIETNQMPADGLTKLLPKQKHQNFLRQLNMVNIK
ncbi:Transposon ty1-dr1 gag-pol polyprotein, partial [Thalictrum thalictroides]